MIPLNAIGSLPGVSLPLIDGVKPQAATSNAAPGLGGASFQQNLMKQLQSLEQGQVDGNNAMQEVATGRVDDVAQTLMRVEQSNVQLQYATQVRNKVVEAYQEILRMQI